MSRRKLFILFLFSCLFLTALFYFSSGKDISKDSEEAVLLNPVNFELKSKEHDVFRSFFSTVGYQEPKEKEILNHPTKDQISFMNNEVYENFNSEIGIDIIVILKDHNKYVLDTYNEDYDRKKEEIKKLIDSFLESFSEDEIQVIYRGEVTKFIALHVSSENVLKKIESHELFDYLFLDKKQELHLLESSPLINAGSFQMQHSTGRNVGVCVIDTGIDYTHPAFGSCSTGDVLLGICGGILGGIDFQSTTSGGIDSDPLDVISGHGTEVAGIISANTPTVIGIAPDSEIASVKIFQGSIGGGFSAAMAGIDWCVNNRNSFRSPIKIITMSFGTGSFDSATTPFYYDSSFITANAAGMFLDASSGNGASSTGISYPASSPLVFSVGSSYDSDLGHMSFTGTCEDFSTSAGKISCFTNRYDLLDILAPGSVITTTTRTPVFVTSVSGTSAAAAHVAGVAALLFSYNKSFSPNQIKNLMRGTGFSTYDPVSTYSYPLLTLSRIFSARPNPVINLVGEPNAGSSIEFSYFDPKNANQNYLVLLSGADSPGITLPMGAIPLAFDSIMYNALFNPSAFSFFNSFGVIDNFGYGRATLDINPNIPPGTTFYAGAISLNNLPFPNNVIGISKSIKITVLPAIVDMALHSNLPGNLAYPSCVNAFDGNIYCFGGSDDGISSNPLDQILKFDHLSGNLAIQQATIPAPIVGSSCVNDFYAGSGVLCFGGFSNTGGRWVFGYDFINDIIINKLGVLPNSPHWKDSSCVSYPFSPQIGEVYCFGGISASGYSNSIVRYDTQTDSFSFMNSILPEQTSLMSCVTSLVHGKIYCFGGLGHTSSMPSSKILEYDPATDTITVKSATLPQGLAGLSCVENAVNGKIYCFGGKNVNLNYSERVLEYDPLTDTLQTTYTRMSPGREGSSCAFEPFSSHIYCFGGEQVDEYQGTTQGYDEILVY